MTDEEREDLFSGRWHERDEAHRAEMKRYRREFAQLHQQLQHKLMLLDLKLSKMKAAGQVGRKRLDALVEDVRKSREETRRRLGTDPGET